MKTVLGSIVEIGFLVAVVGGLVAEADEVSANMSRPQEIVTEAVPQIVSSTEAGTATGAPRSAESGTWEGTYVYEEFAPPNQGWNYELIVSKKDKEYTAQLNIDGFQTMRRLVCDGVVDGSRLLLKFSSYGPDDSHYSEDFTTGQLLVMLEKLPNTDLLTYWKELTPQLEMKQSSDNRYFTYNVGQHSQRREESVSKDETQKSTENIQERDSRFSGTWSGSDGNFFLNLMLIQENDNINGIHSCGDHEGITIDGPEADEGAITVSGKIAGDTASIEIKVGYNMQKMVTGTITYQKDGLLWEMKDNAPDFNVIPNTIYLFRVQKNEGNRIEESVKEEQVINNVYDNNSTNSALAKKGVVNGVLYFKGLYLGMPLEDAANVLERLGMNPDRDPSTGKYAITKMPLAEGVIRVSHSPFPNKSIKSWQVGALDNDNPIVIGFQFYAQSTVDLFDIGDMSASEFAEMFCESYGIPRLEPYEGDVDPLTAVLDGGNMKQGGIYRDRVNGWELIIFDDKELRVSMIKKLTETKFD